MRWHAATVVALVMVSVCVSGGAQSAMTMTAEVPPPIGVLGGTPGTKGQPYSLVEMTTQIRTLANGTTSTYCEEHRQMRDSEGRVRTEFAPMNKDGEFKVLTVVLSDPVSRTATTMFVRARRAEVTHFTQPKPLTLEQQARMAQNRVKSAALPSPFENLPPETISGFYATGRRLTMTIPAGQVGNGHDIHVVEDAWTSPVLNINMKTTTDDPRVGKVTTQVTQLDRNEPATALFQIPADYKVTDRTQ